VTVGGGYVQFFELGNHDLLDGRPGHHDGDLAMNGIAGAGSESAVTPEYDPSLRISLPATARQEDWVLQV
jgi:hypothetical protein